MAQRPQRVSYHDGAAVEDSRSPHEYLLSLPRGGYTTFRTCADASRVYRLSQHCARLSDSVRMMREAEVAGAAPPGPGDLVGAEAGGVAFSLPSQDWVRRHISQALREIRSHIRDAGELRVSVLVTAFTAHPEFYAIAEFLPRPDPRKSVMIVKRSHRVNPGAKDISWMRERESLEREITGNVDEIVMEEGGRISEGISSNFFAIVENGAGFKEIRTAPEGECLTGTVRATVLEECARLGYRLVYERPRLADLLDPATRWKGCFVSSTSRIVKPCTELRVSAEAMEDCPGLAERYPMDTSDAEEVRKAVCGSMLAEAEEY